MIITVRSDQILERSCYRFVVILGPYVLSKITTRVKRKLVKSLVNVVYFIEDSSDLLTLRLLTFHAIQLPTKTILITILQCPRNQQK